MKKSLAVFLNGSCFNERVSIAGAFTIGLPRLTEISVTRGSELAVRFRFVFSIFRFVSRLYFRHSDWRILYNIALS